jgi:co-chaperonin GroES (HSP10)
MDIKPNIDYLQVVPIKEEDPETASGIILTTGAEDIKQKIGIVVARGEGFPEMPMRTPIGDVVLYQEGNQLEFFVAGESKYFVREGEIIASLGPYDNLEEAEGTSDV